MRVSENLTNAEYIPRIRELQAQGAGYWTVKVLHGGYELSYALPTVAQGDLFSKTSSSEQDA